MQVSEHFGAEHGASTTIFTPSDARYAFGAAPVLPLCGERPSRELDGNLSKTLATPSL
jgi:hypothetical protein